MYILLFQSVRMKIMIQNRFSELFMDYNNADAHEKSYFLFSSVRFLHILREDSKLSIFVDYVVVAVPI